MVLTDQERIQRLEDAVFGPGGGSGDTHIKKLYRNQRKLLDKVIELQTHVIPGMGADPELLALRLEIEAALTELEGQRVMRGGGGGVAQV